MSQLISLAYSSLAVQAFGDDELASLLKSARRQNEAEQITGMLLYKSGQFLQVLEGETLTVYRLYERIRRDRRHHGVTQIYCNWLPERHFPEWSMGFRDLSRTSLSGTPGASPIFDLPFAHDSFRRSPSETQCLLLSFRGLT